MTNQPRTQRHALLRLAPLAGAVALFGAACGSTTTASSPADTEPVATPDTAPVAPTTTQAPPATAAPPVTDAPPATGVPAPTCGDFGPIPPTPDSMATEFFDTNGDGEPDFVTAYAGHGHPWTLRVVQGGVTSEALIPDVLDYAGIIGALDVETIDHVQVQDNDTLTIWTFATNTDGCVELIDTEPGTDPDPIDELVLTTPTIPVPTVPTPPPTIDPVIVAPPAPTPCGVFDPIPADTHVTSDLAVDIDADGAADDQVITYFDDVFTLRSITDGVVSEIEVPDVGASSVAALGVGNVGEISAGNELVVRTGGGASGARIGFFGHDSDGCLFEFTRNGGSLQAYVGATIGTSSGAFCSEGIIAQWEYSLDDDGTYSGSSAAWFESTAGNFTYLPASDDFSEGVALEDLSPAELQCFGFGL